MPFLLLDLLLSGPSGDQAGKAEITTAHLHLQKTLRTLSELQKYIISKSLKYFSKALQKWIHNVARTFGQSYFLPLLTVIQINRDKRLLVHSQIIYASLHGLLLYQNTRYDKNHKLKVTVSCDPSVVLFKFHSFSLSFLQRFLPYWSWHPRPLEASAGILLSSSEVLLLLC